MRSLFILFSCVMIAMAQDALSDPLRRGEPVPAGFVAVVRGQGIPRAELVDELVRYFMRPNNAGAAVLESMERELLLNEAAAARGFAATEADIDLRIAAIEEQLKPHNKTLKDMLAVQKVSMTAFRSKTRGLVLLEKLARDELKLPLDKPVESFHCNLWLKQATESKPSEHDRAKLPAGIISRIGTTDITEAAFARELILNLPSEEIVKAAEPVLQLRLAEILLNEAKLELTPADLETEWAWHAADFERDPAHGGVQYETVVQQVQGCTKVEFQKTRSFRVRAALSVLTRHKYDAAALEQAFQRMKNLYGPVLELRHLLVRCSDDPAAKGKLPNMAEGEQRLKAALAQLDKGVSFADIARLHSDDLSTKANGGMMPPTAPGRYAGPQQLMETALTLELGTMSAPFSTNAGWHVIRLEKSSPLPPLAAVQDDLLRVLGRDYFREQWNSAGLGINFHLE